LTGKKPLTVATAHQLLEQKKISPTELIAMFLEEIERKDPNIKAWVRLQKDEAMEVARNLDLFQHTNAEMPTLFAIPYGAKDIICTKNMVTEAGSRLMKGYRPEQDASVVRMLENSGAVMLGKTATTEFASKGEAPKTRNPWGLEHTPGGSSTGSAAAVASGMALFALGTQTMGSLSRPAAYTGLTALKGSYGRVSKAGIFPSSWSLDHVGALTKNVEDAVLVYNEITGYDPEDEATWFLPKQRLYLNEKKKKYTIGVIRDAYFQADSESMEIYEETLRELEEIGYRLKTVYMPKSFEMANAAQQVVLKSENASFHRLNYRDHASLFGEHMKSLIEEGAEFSAHHYIQAQRTRVQFKQELMILFQDVDVLITPAAPSSAPLGIKETGSPAFNLPFSNAGVPTLTLPMGFTLEKTLPVGMQLIGKPLEEQKLIDIGHRYQKGTNWHLKKPGLDF
jgi:aspartyl-tRNA(Asn)/glutamyl-tRNA(Gln) amidotransferase subunit A